MLNEIDPRTAAPMSGNHCDSHLEGLIQYTDILLGTNGTSKNAESSSNCISKTGSPSCSSFRS